MPRHCCMHWVEWSWGTCADVPEVQSVVRLPYKCWLIIVACFHSVVCCHSVPLVHTLKVFSDQSISRLSVLLSVYAAGVYKIHFFLFPPQQLTLPVPVTPRMWHVSGVIDVTAMRKLLVISGGISDDPGKYDFDRHRYPLISDTTVIELGKPEQEFTSILTVSLSFWCNYCNIQIFAQLNFVKSHQMHLHVD